MIQRAADGTLDQVEKVKQALAKFELVSQADTENEESELKPPATTCGPPSSLADLRKYLL